jgi:hypothetical protein
LKTVRIEKVGEEAAGEVQQSISGEKQGGKEK